MADYVYRLPPDQPAAPPAALLIGMDWRELHTPPVAGGLRDQPLRLMKDMRLALNVYDAIQSYQYAQNLDADGFNRFCAQFPGVMRVMQMIWQLEEGN